MKEMWAKGYLEQIEMLSIKINQLESERAELRERMTSLSGLQYGEKVQSSSRGDQIQAQIARFGDLTDQIDRTTDQLVDLRVKIVRQIQDLKNPAHVDLLYMRYVEYKSFERIAVDMGYSYDRTRHLHKSALQEFESRHTIAH